MVVATFDNKMNDHFVLLIQNYMKAGRMSVREWHENAMSEASGDSQGPDEALEYSLRNVFTLWAMLANEINFMTAEEIVSIETWERKRVAIETTVTAILEFVKSAILEVQGEILGVKRYIARAAKEIGELSREEADK